MKYIHNKEIDRDKWDDLVANSSEPRIYMLSWYLDITCPNWKAIVWKDYKIVLPLFVRSFYFLPYVPPPLLSQQTGIIFYSGVSYQRELNEFFKSIILKLFVRFSISFHSGVNIKEIAFPKAGNLDPKRNFVLNLNQPKEILNQNFNDNRKRNLKKALSLGWSCHVSTDIKAAIEMYKTNQGVNQKGLKNTYQILEDIYTECEKRSVAELYCCRDQNAEAIAWCFFASFKNRIYYLFGSMNETGKKHSAMSLIFDFVINKYCNQDYILDFEGGNLQGIGTYFASFGAIPEEYYSFTRNYI